MTSLNGAIFQAPRTKKLLLVGLVGGAIGLLGVSSGAEPPYGRTGFPLYRVTLEDESGAPLKTFGQRGTTFVLGFEGERYEVRIDNDSGSRVEAVLSVDGRDSISGDVADYVGRRGYVVPAHGSIHVSGFRQSLDRVAAFRFSSPASSYSSRMGTPENVGVIGVAFFPERPVYRPRWLPSAREYPRVAPRSEADKSSASHGASEGAPAAASPPSDSARAAPSGGGADPGASRDRYEPRADSWPAPQKPQKKGRLGTEYGESTWSSVSEVPFQRQNTAYPAVIVSFRYDDANGLEARGIDVYPRPSPECWAEAGCGDPEAFPRNRFAPPPP